MAETYELQFGALDWSPAAQVDDVQVRVFGLRRGKAVPVVQVVESLIQDGGLERVERFENRDQQVILAIDASDSRALAEYESTLFREVQKVRNELRYTPPDGFAPAGVFDVLWADLTFADNDTLWDLDEVLRGRRNYVLTLRCLPFARSVDPFTVTGVTSTGTTTTTVNDASSTTGWTALGGTLGSTGSEVTVPVDSLNQTIVDQPSLVLTPASPIDMAAFPFFVITWRVPSPLGPFDNGPYVYADGSPLSRVATRYDSTADRYVSTYSCPDASVAVLRIQSPRVSSYVGGTTTGTFRVDTVEKTDVAPMASTKRQKVTVCEVPGSARTPAALSVSHASSALGNVLVYTCPELASGYVPALSTWATAAGSTVEGTISGQEFSVSSTDRFSVPARTLPSGEFELLVRARRTSGSTTVTTFTATCQVSVGGVEVDPAQSRVTVHSVGALAAGDGNYLSLGSFTLPPVDLPAGSAASILIAIDADEALTVYDEAWLFYMPDDGSAALSQVPCSTGTPAAGGPSSRLWLQPASVDHPYPRALVGTQADQSDARGVSGAASNWSEHNVPAGPNFAFVVTPGAEDAVTEWSGYARWHTHPAS